MKIKKLILTTAMIACLAAPAFAATPKAESIITHDQITLGEDGSFEVLERVDGDFGRSIDWTNILSLGEQQRVSFARIFLRKPVLAFLDEATSSLDEANERLLYQRLRELGISFVSVGHRSTLKEFHDHLITLNKDGTVEISGIPT